jgi:hypothetical protein
MLLACYLAQPAAPGAVGGLSGGASHQSCSPKLPGGDCWTHTADAALLQPVMRRAPRLEPVIACALALLLGRLVVTRCLAPHTGESADVHPHERFFIRPRAPASDAASA